MASPAPGYFYLHKNPGLNFTLNRLASTVPEAELREIAAQIKTLDDWVRTLRAFGEKAEQEERLIGAARLYQGAEFYMSQGDPGKAELYQRSLELFNRGLPELARSRDKVPYESGYMPAVLVPAVGAERDTLVIHSGFDGLLEEMYPLLQPFAAAGYTVIAFEGPGQGAALRKYGLHMPHDWEQPVSALLDHYSIKECTLVGMSLGGYLAPRAAAFEKRVRRVVAWGAMHDFYSVYRLRLGEVKFRLLTALLDLKLSGAINRLISKAAEKEPILRWSVAHGMHVSGTHSPFAFLQWVRSLNLREAAAQIEQDVLLIMGNQDHLVPKDQLYVQAQSLVNARSVTTHMLSGEDHAAQHCQVGNSYLPARLIVEWLASLEARDADCAA